MTTVRRQRIGIAVESSLWGGLETHAVDLARIIASRGHHPMIICSNTHTKSLFQPKTACEIAVVPSFATSGTLTLFRALRALAIDACVFEKGTLHAASLRFELAARVACGRYITIEQLSPSRLPEPSNRRILGIRSPSLWRRRMIRRGWMRSVLPQTVVCVSQAVASALREDYKFPSRKLMIVRNGVDVDRFIDDPSHRLELRAEWGMPASAMVFGAVCRLVPEKGLDTCLEAFGRLVTTAASPEYLVVVGDGPERHKLETLSGALNLDSRVRFVGFRTDVPAVLSAVDCLVLSSRMEGLPLIVAESLSVGRPVIASRIAGTPEILSSDDLGWLVAPGDVEELTRAMESAASRPPERVARMRSAARKHAEQSFSAVHSYSRIAAVLEGTG